MRKLLLMAIISLLISSSCNQTAKSTPVKPIVSAKQDTVFLNVKGIRDKYWIEFGHGGEIKKPWIMKFLNDSVVKYYLGDTGCWDENYKSWERFYDCYKTYNDTIETIEKLVPNPKNDNKYQIITFMQWPRKYYRFKFYVDYNTTSKGDTVLRMDDGKYTRMYHTLFSYRSFYKHKYPLLLDKQF